MRVFLLMLLIVSTTGPSAYGQGSLNAIVDGLSNIEYDFSRWPYPLYAEVSERLQELAVQYPRLRGTDSQSLYIQVMQLEIMQDGCVVTHCNPLLRGGS